MKTITLGILAHVDSGKTTLSEALLYKSGEIEKPGRVDHGDSFLDGNRVERNRGITVFSKQAEMEWDDLRVTLLDTPGHVDFSAEMERTLSVLDYAVLVISAADGIQSHTETLWQLLRRYGIPTFVFVNKMDLSLYRKEEILEMLRKRFGHGFVDFSGVTEAASEGRPFGGDEALVDELTLSSETLMEKVLEGKAPDRQDLAEAVSGQEIFPCCFGSALKIEGIDTLMNCIRLFTSENPEQRKEFGAKVFKIARSDRGERLTFMKITGGDLAVRDIVRGKDRDGESWEEKINQIRIYSGLKYRVTDSVSQGMVCAVTGLTRTIAGDGLGAENSLDKEILEPFLVYSVILDENTDRHRALGALKMMSEEDPKLSVRWDPDTDEIVIHIMGEVQLEILKTLIRERFGFDVGFGAGRIMYKETIDDQVEGIGHFEPLRHYAEVHLVLEPGERGSGLVFSSTVSEDILDRNWQRLIMTHLEEKAHVGVLTGSPITDMKVTLAAGRAHKKHTDGGDFRQATYRALRNGLMKADSVLLEPWLEFAAEVPMDLVGRLMTDIQSMNGRFGEPETSGDVSLLKGTIPASVMMEYQSRFMSFTRGAGKLSCHLSGYDRCPDQDAVVRQYGYDPERDVDNPADSVFCTHGESSIVKWYDIEEYMHIPGVLAERPEAEDDEFVRERVMDYGRVLAGDDELMAIFEKTYGPVKENRLGQRSLGRVRGEGGRSRKSSLASLDLAPKTPEKERPNHVRTCLFVDGDNITNNWGALKELADVDYGSARQKLTEILCNYQGVTQYDITIVFDAYKVGGGTGSSDRYHNVNIVFTKEEETADSFIERATYERTRKNRRRKKTSGTDAGAPGKTETRVIVATSDAQIQQIALGNGALRISARELEQDIGRVEESVRRVLDEMRSG